MSVGFVFLPLPDVGQPPMDEASLNNVFGDINHKLGVFGMSNVEDPRHLDEVFPWV